LGKSILDGSWGMLIRFTSCKAEEAGKIVVKVNSRNTSQECSVCGALHKISLSDRIFTCSTHTNNFLIDRDLNASVNILKRAFEKLGWGPPEVKLAELGASVFTYQVGHKFWL